MSTLVQRLVATSSHRLLLPTHHPAVIHCSSLHTTRHLDKVQAGLYKKTRFRTKALTYEMAGGPYDIGYLKLWNSWHTANLSVCNENDSPYHGLWDYFIRKFMYGTWHDLFVSEVIIKRRFNCVYIGGVIQQTVPPRRIYFLIGYTEELLSHFMKCPVKVELQSVTSRDDVVYTYV